MTTERAFREDHPFASVGDVLALGDGIVGRVTRIGSISLELEPIACPNGSDILHATNRPPWYVPGELVVCPGCLICKVCGYVVELKAPSESSLAASSAADSSAS